MAMPSAEKPHLQDDEEEKGAKSSSKKIVYPVLYPVDKLNEFCEPRGHLPDKSLTFLRSIWHDEKCI
jgi:hypothetical protein